MAYELYLVRFGPPRSPAQGKVLLGELRKRALALVPADDPLCKVGAISHGSFKIALRFSEAKVADDLVEFLIDDFEQQTIPLIHAIAIKGEYVITNAEGPSSVVVMKAAQLKLLPAELRKPKPAVCTSPKRLAALLGLSPGDISGRARPAKGRAYQWSKNHKRRRLGHGDPYPDLPGLRETHNERFLFLQTKPDEGAMLLMDRFHQFLKARKKLKLPLPGGGGVGNSDWIVRTPTGETFIPWNVSCYAVEPRSEHTIPAKIAAWLDILRDFARQSERASATISAGKGFVLSDGPRHPLGACESRRTTDDEG
jgi:hypothetical protein